jgi:hypothetical protein
MRILLFACGLLVLLNVSLLFWPDSVSSAGHIYAAKEDLNPHFIRLNKEIEDKYLSAEPRTITDGEFRLAANSNAGCYRLGPFMHKANYELAQAVLFNADVDYQKSTRESKQSTVYRVFLGPFATQAEAVDQRAELKQDNILDHFVRKVEEGEYIVSLGIYTTQESAENAVAMFDGKIPQVKLAQENLLLPNSYWLHFSIVEGDQLKEQLALMDWGEQSAKLGKYQCRSV